MNDDKMAKTVGVSFKTCQSKGMLNPFGPKNACALPPLKPDLRSMDMT